MEIPVIGFIPPIVGVDETFNTLRLGGTFAKRLAPNQMVFLMNEKTKTVFGNANVVSLSVGELKQMCLLHGAQNHTEIGVADPENSGSRLFQLMQKIYGPHIATESKRCTVIYLRRAPDAVESEPQRCHNHREVQRQDG
jgi:hypothetical protein